MLPLVDSVMHRLGLVETYRAHSQLFDQYVLHGRHGQLLQQCSIRELLGDFGEFRGIDRGALLDVLASDGVPVAHHTTIAALQNDATAARVRFSAASGSVDASFDAVIVSEGIHSATRSLILPDAQVETYDSGWGGWVVWIDQDPTHPDRGEEFWGAGCFVGLYPVKGRTGIIICGDRTDTAPGVESFIATVRASLGGRNARCDAALDAMTVAPDPYFWMLTDCRSAHWAVDRTLLLGDTAAGFLPTAGVGAAMAMEAAGMLAARLASTSPGDVTKTLHDFETNQRPRTEGAQTNSRQLAKLMFHRSKTLALIRDLAVRIVPLRFALGPIRKLHTQQQS